MDEWSRMVDGNVSTRNIENVFTCFCGNHPLPEFPPYESRHRAGEKGNNILVSGVARSGSTVCWQIINLLNDKRVLKSHGFSDCCPTMFRFEKVIVTVRHPFDAYYSFKRAFGDKDPQDLLAGQWNDVGAFVLLKKLQSSIKYRPDMDIVFLKYEDFWSKDRERILFLSEFIGKEINEEELEKILSETSLDRNIKISNSGGQDFSDESKYRDTILPRIHSGHVGEKRGIPGQGSQLKPEEKDRILKNIEWVFDEFGYNKVC